MTGEDQLLDTGLDPVCVLGVRLRIVPRGKVQLTFATAASSDAQTLRALVDNGTAREIAAMHGVSIATVRTQIQAVREKLGARSIDALLLQAAALPPVTARC